MSQTFALVLRAGLSEKRRSFIKPPHLREFYFGFIARIYIGIASAIVPMFILGVIGFFNGWKLTTPMLVGFAVIAFLTILFGEHARSRAYERTAPTRRPMDDVGESMADMLAVFERRRRKTLYQRSLKRAFDCIVATCAIFVLLPTWLVTAILVKLDSRGPITIKHQYVGLHGRPFTLRKFRTAAVTDGRETRVGYWLARASLDDTLAFLNVFTGSMSLVGPAPLSKDTFFAIRRQYPETQRLLKVRPGVTGVRVFATRRNAKNSYAESLQLEELYIAGWSFRLDLMILFRTFGIVFFKPKSTVK